MRFLRIGEPGRERPAILAADGTIRDLSTIVSDVSGSTLEILNSEVVRALDPRSLPIVDPSTRIGPCLTGVGNFICIGLNYKKHADETGNPYPKEPIVFSKATSAISGPNDPIVLPPEAVQGDWEVELGVVIGKPTYLVSEADALSHVFGYCAVNDVSERHFQSHRGGQWMKGKSSPTFAPLGPWLVTSDDVPDPQALALSLSVNGVVQQASSTADMIFSVAEILSYLSRFMRLMPGDIVATGTPEGVALGRKPPNFLRPGDQIEMEIEGLGRQYCAVMAFPD